MRPIDLYFDRLTEPSGSCLQAMRQYLLRFEPGLEETWKYRMPVYTCKGKMFCYLWTRKKDGMPYLGIVKGRDLHFPWLLQEQRSKMKIMLLEPGADLPLDRLELLLKAAAALY